MNPWSKSKTQLSKQGRNATENEVARCMYCTKEIEESMSREGLHNPRHNAK